MAPFQRDEWVLLVTQKGKKWLVQVQDAPFSSHLGAVSMGDVIGREEGDSLQTNKGAKVYLFRPTLEEFIFAMDRRTQIIYPKDLGAMIFYGDLYPGCTVLESGVGSGALSLAILRALGGSGRLISVEKREEFARTALKNIHKFYGQAPQNHDLVVSDIQDFHLACRVDRVFLDLPEPWHAVRPVSHLLREGGLLLSLSPNVGQAQLMHKELKSNGFANITTFELLRRDWKIDEKRARPNDRMVAHTGFITLAKKTPVAFDGSDEES